MTERKTVTNEISASLEDIHRALLHEQFYYGKRDSDEEKNDVTITQAFDGTYLIHVKNGGADFTYTLQPFNSTGFTQVAEGTAAGRLRTNRTYTYTPAGEFKTHEVVEADYEVQLPLMANIVEQRWAGMLEEELDGRIRSFEEYAQFRRARGD